MIRATHFHPNGILNGRMSYSHRVGGGSGLGWNDYRTSPFDTKKFGRDPKVNEPLLHPVFRPGSVNGSVIPMEQDASGAWERQLQVSGALGVWRPHRLTMKVLALMLLGCLGGVGCVMYEPPGVDVPTDARSDAVTPVDDRPTITWPNLPTLPNNCAFVRWDPPSETEPGRTIVRYEVSWSDGDYNYSKEVDSPYTAIDILNPDTAYSFGVRAVYDGETYGRDSDEVHVVTDSSLVVRYMMDEGAGTMVADSSGNENNATLLGTNPAASWTQGVYGTGVTFGGVSALGLLDDVGASSAAPDSLNFDGTAPFVVEAAVNRMNTGACSMIVGKFDGDKGWDLSIDTTNKLFFAMFNDSHQCAPSNCLRAGSEQTFAVPDVHRYVTVSFGGSPDGSDVRMFVDGASIPVEVQTSPLTTSAANDQIPTTLGAYGSYQNPNCAFEGTMYYLAVYRRSFDDERYARQSMCAFLASKSTIPLPAACD